MKKNFLLIMMVNFSIMTTLAPVIKDKIDYSKKTDEELGEILKAELELKKENSKKFDELLRKKENVDVEFRNEDDRLGEILKLQHDLSTKLEKKPDSKKDIIALIKLAKKLNLQYFSLLKEI